MATFAFSQTSHPLFNLHFNYCKMPEPLIWNLDHHEAARRKWCHVAIAIMTEVQISDLKLCKELKDKLLGLDREGLRIGLGIIDCRSEPDRRSEAINFGTC